MKNQNDLKTLKDINPANDFDKNKYSVRYGNIKLYSDKDLRDAAREWIKKLRMSAYEYPDTKKLQNELSVKLNYDVGYNTGCQFDMIRFINCFFNLEEENE